MYGIGRDVPDMTPEVLALGRRWSLRTETGTIHRAGLFYRFAWE